jgi:hypothetical protein
MNFRMQRFHAAVHDLRKARVAGDVGDGDAARSEELRRTSGREDLDLAAHESLSELDEARLVGDGHKCAADGNVHLARKAELPQLLA